MAKKVISLNLTEEAHERLKEKAREKGISVSALIQLFAMEKRPPETSLYLEELRRIGQVNMNGAVPFLVSQFDMSEDEAKKTLTDWIKTYNRNDYIGVLPPFNG